MPVEAGHIHTQHEINVSDPINGMAEIHHLGSRGWIDRGVRHIRLQHERNIGRTVSQRAVHQVIEIFFLNPIIAFFLEVLDQPDTFGIEFFAAEQHSGVDIGRLEGFFDVPIEAVAVGFEMELMDGIG